MSYGWHQNLPMTFYKKNLLKDCIVKANNCWSLGKLSNGTFHEHNKLPSNGVLTHIREWKPKLQLWHCVCKIAFQKASNTFWQKLGQWKRYIRPYSGSSEKSMRSLYMLLIYNYSLIASGVMSASPKSQETKIVRTVSTCLPYLIWYPEPWWTMWMSSNDSTKKLWLFWGICYETVIHSILESISSEALILKVAR